MKGASRFVWGLIAGVLIGHSVATAVVIEPTGTAPRPDDEPTNVLDEILTIQRAVLGLIRNLFRRNVHDRIPEPTDNPVVRASTAECLAGSHHLCDGHGPCSCTCHTNAAQL